MACSTGPSYPVQGRPSASRTGATGPRLGPRATHQPSGADRVQGPPIRGRAGRGGGVAPVPGPISGRSSSGQKRTSRMGRFCTRAAAYRESRLTAESSTRPGQISWTTPSTTSSHQAPRSVLAASPAKPPSPGRHTTGTETLDQPVQECRRSDSPCARPTGPTASPVRPVSPVNGGSRDTRPAVSAVTRHAGWWRQERSLQTIRGRWS